jgi:hypothetical protein
MTIFNRIETGLYAFLVTALLVLLMLCTPSPNNHSYIPNLLPQLSEFLRKSYEYQIVLCGIMPSVFAASGFWVLTFDKVEEKKDDPIMPLVRWCIWTYLVLLISAIAIYWLPTAVFTTLAVRSSIKRIQS